VVSEIRRLQTAELSASAVASGAGALLGGFTWSSLAYGLASGAITLVGTIVLIFLFHLIRSPPALYYQQASEIAGHQRVQTELLPELAVRVIEAFIHPSPRSAICFVHFSLHNTGTLCDAPRDGYSLRLTLEDGSTHETLRTFDLLGTYCLRTFEYDVSYDVEGRPHERERELSREILLPPKGALRRGKPVFGWLGFRLTGLPTWPYYEELLGQHLETISDDEGNYLDEIWVDDTDRILLTTNVQSITLCVTDPFEQIHVGTKSPPFHEIKRRITPVLKERVL
jgi:hypothetical protein